jgi:hypothetical protein
MPTAADVDLDVLLDRLLARAAEREPPPLVNAAGEEVNPLAPAGRVTVHPNDLIASTWGNLVYGQSVNAFASTADRDAQWPAPADGAVCYTVAELTFWCRASGVWQRLGPTVKPATVYLSKPTTGFPVSTQTLFTGTLPSLSVPGTLVATLYGLGGFTASGTSTIKPDLKRTDTSASILAYNDQAFSQTAAQMQAWAVPLPPLAIPAGSAIPVSCTVVLTGATTIYCGAYLLGSVYAS